MGRMIHAVELVVATIWGEARGESADGKVAVAEVIRNRTLAKYASDGTLEGTVLRPYQFSCWNTNDPNRIPMLRLDDLDPTVIACREAWYAAGRGSNLVAGAVLYYNPTAVPRTPMWAMEGAEVARVGRHVFYKARRGREAS